MLLLYKFTNNIQQTKSLIKTFIFIPFGFIFLILVIFPQQALALEQCDRK
jgi:hypothetical protein